MTIPDQEPHDIGYWLLELYKSEVDSGATSLPTALESFGNDVEALYDSMTGLTQVSTRAVPALIFKMWQAGMIV